MWVWVCVSVCASVREYDHVCSPSQASSSTTSINFGARALEISSAEHVILRNNYVLKVEATWWGFVYIHIIIKT